MKKMMFFFVFGFMFLNIFGQDYKKFFIDKKNQAIENKYIINIENNNFFKNNEFFNDFIAGYTLFGYGIKPKFIFSPYNNVKFNIGFYALKYFGIKNFSKFQPIFSVEYCPNENMKIIFGEISGTLNHNLPDAVLDYEIFLTNNLENGIQILFSGKRLKSDAWVNWKQFIFQNSDYPEIIEGGISNKFTFFKQSENHKLFFDLSGIACHTGGQIDTSGISVETVTNTISGIKYDYKINKKLLKNVRFSISYIFATDLSPEKRLKYLSGYGILSGIEFNNKNYDFKIQYWSAKKFFSKSGNPIFQSVSHRYTDYYENNRSLIVSKLFYRKNVYKEFKIGLGFDTFYDLKNKTFEYSFGFYINSDFNFLIKIKNTQ